MVLSPLFFKKIKKIIKKVYFNEVVKKYKTFNIRYIIK